MESKPADICLVCMVNVRRYHDGEGCNNDAEHVLVEMSGGIPCCTFYEPKPGLALRPAEGVQ